MKFKKLKLTLAGLIISVCSLNSNAGIIISGDVTAGTGVFTITDDIIFNLVDGTAHNANADPYAILFHDWNTSSGGWANNVGATGAAAMGGKNQLVGEKLDLRREPTPFNTSTDDIFVVDGGTKSNILTSAPLFDGNFYNRGSVLFFSDTYQQVRQLGFDDGSVGDDGSLGGLFVIGAGSWDMPTVAGWDLYGEFSGDATIYRALGYNAQANNAIPVATTNLTSVPEPSTLAIFALGIIGLASRRFKK